MSIKARLLLEKWRKHIREVYERRGRAQVYTPHEVLHTCHGCGAGACQLTEGLCKICCEEFSSILTLEK